MKQFLLETHAHTSEVSCCANVEASKLVELYIEAGYSGVVITDHYSRYTFCDNIDAMSTLEAVDYYLTGYRKAKQCAGNRLTVLLGMELTFYENSNDYLVYGVTEEFLYTYSNLMRLGIHEFSRLARDNGLLVFQAHPFRNSMTITPPRLLDGIEVCNCNARHDSRNDIAAAWADKFGLLKTSGSDFHELYDVGQGGIITSEPIISNDMLVSALKNHAALKKSDSK